MHAHSPAFAAWRTFALEWRRAEQKRTAGKTLWSLSPCFFEARRGSKTRRFLGARTWCWVLSGYVWVCDLCEGSGVNHHHDCAVLSTARLQSKVYTNAYTQTHTSAWVALFCLSQASILEKTPQDYQTSRRLRQPPLSDNRFTSQPASSCFPHKMSFHVSISEEIQGSTLR